MNLLARSRTYLQLNQLAVAWRMEQIAAVVILAAVAALIGWLAVVGRRGAIARSKLTIEEQKRLEQADAIWSQRFGF